MIHGIDSTLESFKTLSFRPGLNILLADKSAGASDRQTRNSSGKSSLILLIHFLLGGKCDPPSIFRSEKLNDETFSMTFDLFDQKTRVERSGGKKNRIVVDNNDPRWPTQPTLDKKTGETHFSEQNWNTVLGHAFFDVLEDESYAPSFRSLFSYFVRREGSGGFAHAEKQNENQQLWDVQVNVSHLLGLDWALARSLHEVRAKETALKTLRKESETGVLGDLVGRTGHLQTRLAVAEKKAKQLGAQLESFQVLPEYRELEKEASQFAVEISEHSNENTLDEERIQSTQRFVTEEEGASSTDVVEMYKEAEIVLPDLVLKQLKDVEKFHEVLIQNRKQHLQGEIDAASGRIEERNKELQRLDGRRLEILNTLAAHGAMDQLNKLQEEYSRQQAEVQDLKKRLEIAEQVENMKTSLTIERATLQQAFNRDHREHQELLNDAIVEFEEFSRTISDHEGSLTIETTENGPQFSIEVEGGRSVGIRNMQIFCFDMMLAVLWTRRRQGPRYLVHDSHLFDGMDSRQIAKAIEIGASQARDCGFQYIVTLNSDMLPMDEFSAGFDPEPFINSVRLSDKTESGGLFGCRI